MLNVTRPSEPQQAFHETAARPSWPAATETRFGVTDSFGCAITWDLLERKIIYPDFSADCRSVNHGVLPSSRCPSDDTGLSHRCAELVSVLRPSEREGHSCLHPASPTVEAIFRLSMRRLFHEQPIGNIGLPQLGPAPTAGHCLA